MTAASLFFPATICHKKPTTLLRGTSVGAPKILSRSRGDHADPGCPSMGFSRRHPEVRSVRLRKQQHTTHDGSRFGLPTNAIKLLVLFCSKFHEKPDLHTWGTIHFGY